MISFRFFKTAMSFSNERNSQQLPTSDGLTFSIRVCLCLSQVLTLMENSFSLPTLLEASMEAIKDYWINTFRTGRLAIHRDAFHFCTIRPRLQHTHTCLHLSTSTRTLKSFILLAIRSHGFRISIQQQCEYKLQVATLILKTIYNSGGMCSAITFIQYLATQWWVIFSFYFQ